MPSTSESGISMKLRGSIENKYGRALIYFCIIFIIALVIFRNFFSDAWPAGGDVLGWISRVYLYGKDFRWLCVWRPYSFGFVEQINSMDFFMMITNLACQGGVETVKVFTFALFLVAGFSMYIFAYNYTRSSLAAFSSSLVYILNQWIFTQYTEMHVDILFGYALAPLLFLLFDRALKSGRLKDSTLFALMFSICLTGFYPGSVVIYTSFLALFLAFYVLTPTSTIDLKKRLKRSLKVVFCSGILALLLSAFYVLPFALNVQARFYSPEFGYQIEEAFMHSYKNMIDSFTLKGVEIWGYINIVDIRSEIDLQLLPVQLILLGIYLLAYFTIVFRRDRYTLFFLFSALISTFLAKGPNPPFDYIFVWAWFNIPHFSVFRAANRFSMITAFSHAFFIAILVSMIISYLSKRKTQQTREKPSETLLILRPDDQEKRAVRLSSDLLDRIVKPFHNFLHHFCVILLILVLLSGFLSCWFFLQHGLQANQPPANALSPYEWIAEQPGDFKIISVGRSPSEWELTDNVTDIGSPGMLTPVGWGHDIGYESSFIHDKPVLQDGGWELKSRMLVDHLRFQQVRGTMTDQLLVLLGALNYKYVVMPPYCSETAKTFFLNQQGAVVVYNQSQSIIVENAFHESRIFGATQHIVVTGGLRSLFSLLKIDSFNPNQTVPIFADQLDAEDIFGNVVFNNSKALLFADSELLDLVMLSSSKMNVITASQYGAASRNYTEYWAPASSWREVGSLVLGGNTLTTQGNNRISIPFEADEYGEYTVLARVGYTQNRGNLAIHVDGLPIKTIRPQADSWAFLKWTNLGSLYLEKGSHTIALTNDGTGWNDVDAVAIVKTSTLDQQIKEVTDRLQEYSGRIVYLLSSAHALAYHLPPEWRLVGTPYQGDMLESFSSSTLCASMVIPREGWYRIAARIAYGPGLGNLTFRLDNFTATVTCDNASEEYGWVELGSSYLTRSNLTISVENTGHVKFDQLAFYSITGSEDMTSLNDVFCINHPSPSINWLKIDESRYVVHVETDEPFFLIFSEAHHPLWKAFVDDQEISPVTAYSVVNGFFINKTGEYDVTLYFTGQTFADIGLKISGITLIATLACLAVYPYIYQRLKTKLQWTKRSGNAPKD